MDTYVQSLMRGVASRGSILSVAMELGVEPRRVFLWLAGTEAPDAEMRRRVLDVFSLRAASHDARGVP